MNRNLSLSLKVTTAIHSLLMSSEGFCSIFQRQCLLIGLPMTHLTETHLINKLTVL